MKTCRKCRIDQPLGDFFADRKAKDGLQAWCKPCKVQSVMRSPSGKRGGSRRSKEQALKRYYANQIQFNISRRIRQSLGGARKSTSWEALVGFSLADLQSHLEGQFQQGMTWESYGTAWHIDHKRPIASFAIRSADSEDFRTCWSLDNLQPLWATENISKGARWT
jgi:hypothetical protein